VPAESSQGFANYKATWPMVISVFEGDWYDAAEIYREWAIPNVDWT
jgi:hypothetical protein